LGYDFVTTNDEYAAPTRWMAARKAIQQIAAALDGDEKKAAELVLALACDERLKAWARLKERKGGERPAIPTGRLRSWLETIPDRRTPTVEKIRTSAQAHFPKHSISKDRLTAALQELDGPRQKGGKKRLFAADIQAKLPSK
jgi:hypothetical protein